MAQYKIVILIYLLSGLGLGLKLIPDCAVGRPT